jgi:acyl dehydratase
MPANITTLDGFKKNQGKVFLFKDQKIDPALVKAFGKMTGDWNDHNKKPTKQFEKPGVQGFLSLALFGGYHKEVCDVPGSDPINVQFSCKLLKKLPVGSTFMAGIAIKDVQERQKYISVEWRYELRNNEEELFLEAGIVIRYSKKLQDV